MANPIDKKTLTLRLSPRSRQAIFNIVRNKKDGYDATKIMEAASLLKKLREGAELNVVKVPDQFGTMQDVNLYTNFVETGVEITPEEKVLAKEQFNAVKGWNADTELEVFTELKEFFN